MPRDICMRMYLCVECMSVYPVYFELLLPPLLRVAAGFFELLLVTWCGVVWCGVVWCGVRAEAALAAVAAAGGRVRVSAEEIGHGIEWALHQ